MVTYHPYSRRGALLFGPPEDGLTNPSFYEEEINPETGMVEQLSEGSSSTYYEKAVVTIKGELEAGSFRYILYGENDHVVFERTFEPGVYYDESFEVYDIGHKQDQYLEFAPETKAKGDGIAIDITYYARGYTRDFGD
ncbi:MAG: hypothetical protein ACI39R_08725 [Lachnospiraceae bacterium]